MISTGAVCRNKPSVEVTIRGFVETWSHQRGEAARAGNGAEMDACREPFEDVSDGAQVFRVCVGDRIDRQSRELAKGVAMIGAGAC